MYILPQCLSHSIMIVYKKTEEWDIKWQWVTTSGKMSDNKWQQVVQRMTTSDREWYNEWQRVTTSDNNVNEWQQMTMSDSEWQTSGVTNENKWEQVK